MTSGAPMPFAAHLKALRERAGFTQEELAAIAGLSVHAISALERGGRRRPHLDTIRALASAFDLAGAAREAFFASARGPADGEPSDQPGAAWLPLALTALLGRDGDMRTLRRWLDEPGARLITLVGPGGVGKTRLALEVARVVAADGAAQVVFVPLAACRNPEDVAPAIGELFGLSDMTASELPARVRGACAGRPTLLVLDNFEHVVDAAPLVAELLSAVATLRVLSTSRARLRVRGERQFVVLPLALDTGPDALSPAGTARSPAVQLFVERVRDVRSDFRLTAGNVHTVAAICRRLDALPLALELAAPWMKTLPPEELLRQLWRNPLFPPVGARDLPERQQTVNATVAWSYHLLGPDERRAFRRIGVLPGQFSVDAASAVLVGRNGASHGPDDALGMVAGLVDRSLLLRAEPAVPDRPMYRMLETVRAYAGLELSAAGELDDALDGMAAYCRHEAGLAADGLTAPDQLEWLDRVRADLDLHRRTLAWLIERGRSDEAADIVSKLMFFWPLRGHAVEGRRWCEQVLGLPSLAAGSESNVLLASAVQSYFLADLGAARSALTRALGLARDIRDTRLAVQVEIVLGHVEHLSGEYDAARDRFARGADASRTLGIPWTRASALNGMAWIAVATGDEAAAQRLLDEAAPVLERTGPWFVLLSLYLSGVLALRRGDADRATAVVHQSLTRLRRFHGDDLRRIYELHDSFVFVYALVTLAAAAVLKGNHAWAARVLGARDAIIERAGSWVVDTAVSDLKAKTERQAREHLGSARWDREYGAGRGLSIRALLKDIARVVRPGPAGAHAAFPADVPATTEARSRHVTARSVARRGSAGRSSRPP